MVLRASRRFRSRPGSVGQHRLSVLTAAVIPRRPPAEGWRPFRCVGIGFDGCHVGAALKTTFYLILLILMFVYNLKSNVLQFITIVVHPSFRFLS